MDDCDDDDEGREVVEADLVVDAVALVRGAAADAAAVDVRRKAGSIPSDFGRKSGANELAASASVTVIRLSHFYSAHTSNGIKKN